MAGPIQTIPQGLLGLLQLKELGKNPPVLVDSVAPNLDLFQLYAQRLMNGEMGLFGGQMSTGNLVNGNHGFQQFFVSGAACIVPQSEMWWVYEYSADVATLAAADTLSGGVAILQQASRPLLVGPTYNDVITARVRSWISSPITTTFFAAPGATFGIYLTDILTGTNINVFGTLRAVRIPL